MGIGRASYANPRKIAEATAGARRCRLPFLLARMAVAFGRRGAAQHLHDALAFAEEVETDASARAPGNPRIELAQLRRHEGHEFALGQRTIDHQLDTGRCEIKHRAIDAYPVKGA